MANNIEPSFISNCCHNIWIFCCISLTVGTVIGQCYNYLKNEDITRLDYKPFNKDVKDLYPSIGFCFTLPIRQEKLSRYGPNITPKAYSDFLAGDNWDENMLKVNYADVIEDLHKYILSYGYMNLRLEDMALFDRRKDGTLKKDTPELRELSFLTTKCITVNIPYMNDQTITQFWISLNHSIFLGEKRLDSPSDNLLSENQFIVVFHYPNQLSGNLVRGMRTWPLRDENAPKDYIMQFNIGNVEVLQRRNKYVSPCTEGSPDFDSKMMDLVLEETKCKPPYWNLTSSLQLCSKPEEIKTAANLIKGDVFGYTKRKNLTNTLPCRTLEKIQYGARDIPYQYGPAFMSGTNSNFIDLWAEFKDSTYKEVINLRSMDRQALLGK